MLEKAKTFVSDFQADIERKKEEKESEEREYFFKKGLQKENGCDIISHVVGKSHHTGVQLSWQSTGLQNRGSRVRILLPLPRKKPFANASGS